MSIQRSGQVQALGLGRGWQGDIRSRVSGWVGRDVFGVGALPRLGDDEMKAVKALRAGPSCRVLVTRIG
ncbi:hypothetical protein D3C87_1276150 [compost metagenome]|jgi:hypothetical protein